MTGRMTITCTLLAVALMLVTAMPASAEIVALKRDAALCTEAQATTWAYGNRDVLDDDFWLIETATEVTVKDTPLYSAGYRYNYGASTVSNYSRMLVSFDLAGLGAVTSVEKAQLRLASTNHNASDWVAQITSTDWTEGTGTGQLPTEENPGAIWRHPNAIEGYAYGWGTDSENPDVISEAVSATEGSDDMGTRYAGTAAGTRTLVIYDVTDIVNDWLVNGADNYGFYAYHGGSSRPVHTSEWTDATEGTTLNPGLFINYVPEPATMGLLGLGFAGMAALRRRRRNA